MVEEVRSEVAIGIEEITPSLLPSTPTGEENTLGT